MTQGHHVAWARSIADAQHRLDAGNADLMLLDLRLPDGSGLELLQKLRRGGDTRPAIILTARDQVSDRIAGLNAGADDYLVKPFDLSELTARLQAVARRSFGAPSLVCHGGRLEVDQVNRQVRLAGAEVVLTGREWTLLELLARRPGSVVPRDRMEAMLAGAAADRAGNTLDVCMSRLRRKLGPGAVETSRGFGYRLKA